MVLKMEDTVLKKINERLVALEIVHTRYSGPRGERGEKGDQGPTGRDGRDSTELRDLRADRNAFREELYAFRQELHEFRSAASRELEALHNHYAAELGKVYIAEVNGFCEQRDKACEEIARLREQLIPGSTR
jgi:hypothetical protein